MMRTCQMDTTVRDLLGGRMNAGLSGFRAPYIHVSVGPEASRTPMTMIGDAIDYLLDRHSIPQFGSLTIKRCQHTPRGRIRVVFSEQLPEETSCQ